jgi:secreted trypsin-like serine protease
MTIYKYQKTCVSYLSLKIKLLSSAHARVTKIIGGEIAIPHSQPYIVSLQLRKSHFCGASIISDTWVLTAAHCTQP